MQKSQTIINIVLFVAIVVLFIPYAIKDTKDDCSVQGEKKTSKSEETSASASKIAYIQVDTLLTNYTFAKEANESLLKKTESSRSQLQRKVNAWQKDAMDFQNKLKNNAFLSRERAESENNRLMRQRQELDQLDQRLTNDLLKEQSKLNEQLRDTINTFLKEYNHKHHYTIILANTANDNVLYAEESCDITNDVVEQLNRRYKK